MPPIQSSQRFVQFMQEAQLANAMSVTITPLSVENVTGITQAAAGGPVPSIVPSTAVDQTVMAAIPPPPKLKIELCFWPEMLREGGGERYDAIRADLGLDKTTDCYRVIPGDMPPTTGRSQSRPLPDAPVGEMAACIDVPAGDLASGAAPRLASTEVIGASTDRPLMTIHSGQSRPEDSLVAVEYAGSWFWIDDTDNHSKRSFIYLSILLSITESGGGGAQLVVTTN